MSIFQSRVANLLVSAFGFVLAWLLAYYALVVLLGLAQQAQP